MNLSFNGFGENTLTFEADSTLTQAGVLVTLTSEGKAAKAKEGDKICGFATNVRAGYAAVQLKGFVSVPKEGELTPGWQTVSASAEGKVVADEDGTQVLVVCVEDGTAGIIL